MPFVVEAKDVGKITLAEFVDEANREAANVGVACGVVWIKRRRRSSPADGYVVCDGATFLRLLSRH